MNNISIRNWLFLTRKMISYNLKIIYGSRFIYFLLAAFVIFIAIIVSNLMTNGAITPSDTYEILTLSGMLILFYPITFGIQSDKDARTLEIIFGIPDYRYKVWFMRMILIFIQAFVILLFMSFLVAVTLQQQNVFYMTIQVMFPLLFMGLLAFFISTIVKSGSGTAVVIIILGFALFIAIEFLERSYWNVFFNPFELGSESNPLTTSILLFKNRVFLTVGAILFMLGGLFNLQQREKFLE